MASSIERRAPIIALCGTSTSTPAEDALAKMVGQLCAQRSALVLCGGLGGVMSSGARGVSEAGGTVIGFLPGSDADEGNEFLTYSIPTGLGEMRNGLLAKAAAGMIAIGGGWGTLSEIGFMMRLGKPVVNLSSWGIQQPGESHNDPSMHWTTDPHDAVEWLFKAIQS